MASIANDRYDREVFDLMHQYLFKFRNGHLQSMDNLNTKEFAWP